MAKTRNTKPGEKTEWMKAHAHLTPKEALAVAQERWPETTLPNIHSLRNLLRAQGIDVPRAKPGGHKKPATPSPEPRRGHRSISPTSAFVLSMPRDMPPAEVVERAGKVGFTVGRSMVAGIRRRHKNKTVAPLQAAQLAIPETDAPEAQAAPRKARKTEPVVLPLGALSTDEADFMGLVLGIGYNRAARLLAQFRVQFFGSIKAQTTDEQP